MMIRLVLGDIRSFACANTMLLVTPRRDGHHETSLRLGWPIW
jgi:hypothetical protein